MLRHQLLEAGARLCSEQGVAGLTLQAVADTVGVTKGGVLHHFPSKQILVETIFNQLLEFFDSCLECAMRDDPEPFGRFSRAYVNASFELLLREDLEQWAALMMSSLTEPALKQRWSDWLAARVKANEATDSSPTHELARYAVDGIWVAVLHSGCAECALPSPLVRSTLLDMTRKKP